MSSALRKAGAVTAVLAATGSAVTVGGIRFASAETATATTGVNIRSGPGTNYQIVGGLVRGQKITAVNDPKNGWVKVRFNGSSAYISAQYLDLDGKTVSDSVTISTSGNKFSTVSLNVRSGPGLDENVIGYVSPGQSVTLTGKQSRGWAEILYGGQRAWVSSQYLASSLNGLPSTSTRVATADLLIRTSSDASFKIITTVEKGSKLQVTGTTQNGYAQVVYNDALRWVTARYLTNRSASGPTVSNGSDGGSGSSDSLPAVVGTRYAQTALNIRSTWRDNDRTLDEVPTGTRLKITGTERNGRAQVIYDGAARWVTAQWLATTRPSSGGSDSSLPDVIGSRYAQTALLIRSTWRENDRTLDEVRTGTKLNITGLRINGRAQIIYNGAKAWVTSEWLSRSKPSAGSSSGSTSGGSTDGRTKGEIALEYAKAQLGKPYAFGAEGPDSFDCSGLTLRAWQAAGVNLPRITYDQIDASPRVAKSDLRPGDLVFFYGQNPSHVGIYAGNGQIINAPRPGRVVEYTSMSYMPFAGATRPG